DEVIGVARLARHGALLFDGRAPDAVLCRTPGLRFVRTGTGGRAPPPLPEGHVGDPAGTKLEDGLLVTTRGPRRALPLPRHVAPLALTRARLDAGTLTIDFAPGAA